MRVLTATLATAMALVPALTAAGPCQYVITCYDIDRVKFPQCSPAEAAEAQLVGPALQACEDIAYFFTKGGPWPNNDKAFYCNVNSPCGMLVPYLMYVRSYADVCDKFKPYYGVMQTFHNFCQNEPVAKLPGDNGLLASLKSSANRTGGRPTPAPSRPLDAETPEPIPNSESPAPTASTTKPIEAPSTATTPTTKPSDNKADANAKTASAASVLSSMGAPAAVSIAAAALHAVLFH